MNYRQPFSGEYPITQNFGETITDPKGHTGIDYGCPLNTPILASADGQVFFAGLDKSGYGNLVILKHDDGNVTLYAHLSSIHVSVLEKVRQGSLIGHSGNTGNSTGAHLHFEIRGADGKPFDPMTVLKCVYDMDKTDIPEPAELKGADAFSEGDLLTVQNRLGVKAFFDPAFSYERVTSYPQGTPFYFTGDTTVNKNNGLTYMRVIPAQFSVWVAVNDGETQLLDK